MFLNCSKLTSLNVSSFNTSNVKNMQGIFYGCSSLTTLDISNFNTRNATNMKMFFYNCSRLTTIYVSYTGWSTSQADASEMFYGCGATSLTYK